MRVSGNKNSFILNVISLANFFKINYLLSKFSILSKQFRNFTSINNEKKKIGFSC